MQAKKKTKMSHTGRRRSLGVAIPTHRGDIIFLNRCLRSIANQTRAPDAIVVAASECTRADVMTVLDPFFHPLVKVLATPQMHNAAENRNRAADVLLAIPGGGVDIICFFDCDDEMSAPYRLEYIERAFDTTTSDFVVTHLHVLHAYTPTLIGRVGEGASPLVTVENALVCMDDIPHPGVVAVVDPVHGGSRVGVDAGHISVRASLGRDQRFDWDCVGREDIEYCARLIGRGYRGVYIPLALATYHNYTETWKDLFTMAVAPWLMHRPSEARQYAERGQRLYPRPFQRLLRLLKERDPLTPLL